MSVELRLYIIDGDLQTHGFSHSMLDWYGGRKTYHLINSKSFDPGMYKLIGLTNKGYMEIDEDAYGEKIRFIKAKDFIKILKDVKDLSPWDIGILEFLKHLDDLTIALYYH
jgi:hypothetical protein